VGRYAAEPAEAVKDFNAVFSRLERTA